MTIDLFDIDPSLDDIMNESDGSDSSDEPVDRGSNQKAAEEEKKAEPAQVASQQQPIGEEVKEPAKTPVNDAQKQCLVDPNAVVYPTPKSDGAAQLGRSAADTHKLSTVDGSADSDLDKFSDINSQDDADEREEGVEDGIAQRCPEYGSELGIESRRSYQDWRGGSRPRPRR